MTEWFCAAKIKGGKSTFDKERTEAPAEDGRAIPRSGTAPRS